MYLNVLMSVKVVAMDSKSVEDLLEASSGVHFSGFHLTGSAPMSPEADTTAASASVNVHKQPFVIGLYHIASYSDLFVYISD